jgi:hypothetical protein
MRGFLQGPATFAISPKAEVPGLVFKYKWPATYTCQTVASAFTLPELSASSLSLSWRLYFSEEDLELSPKKPLWFLPGDKFKVSTDKVHRLV